MIISKMIDLGFTNDSAEIENELRKMGIEPLRWAVIKVDDNRLILGVTFYIK